MFKLSLYLAASLIAASSGLELTLINNSEQQDVLVYVSDSISENAILLKASEQQIVSINETHWTGRIFGRIDCLTEETCANVELPATTAEISIGPGYSFYSVSEADGFNIKLSLEPTDNDDQSPYNCEKTECVAPILDGCPEELQISNSDGEVIACPSACYALDEDVYCCRGIYANPGMCKSEDWPVNYAAYFIESCPNTYVYAYDNQQSLFTCESEKFTVTLL